MRLPRRSRLLAAAVALAALGCGGSGGGVAIVPPPVPPPAFEGPYHLAFFRGTTQPADVAAALWGIMDSDGVDALSTGTTDQNENGTLSNPVGALNGTFTIAGDGTTSWFNLGLESHQGGTSAAKDAQVVGGVRAGVTVSSMALLLRRAGTFSNASLASRYRFCLFGSAAPSGPHLATVGNLAFDGAGAAQTTVVSRNADGTVAGLGSPIDTTYAVASDGRMVLGSDLEGGVLEGNDVLILSGFETANDIPIVLAAVRTQAGATNALFQGTYAAVFLEFNLAAGRYRVLTGTVVADGAGNLTLAGQFHQEGTVGIVPAAAQTYSVAVDGSLTVGSGIGAVSPTGAFAVLGGSTVGGGNPTFAFLVRV